MNPEIKLECKHVNYCPRPKEGMPDLHFVKLAEYLPDGSRVNRTKLLYDYKKRIYISKYNEREYQQKKEAEYLRNVDEYKVTNYELFETVCQALDMNPNYTPPKKALHSPYLYGNDLSSCSDVKYRYMNKYKTNGMSTVAVFDIETNMTDRNKSDEIIMATLSFKNRIITRVLKSAVAKHSDVINQLNKKMNIYLGEYIKKRNITWDVDICDTPGGIIKEIFAKAHEWGPDFVSIWNINFDLPITLKALEAEGIDPKDVFCDPEVPPPYRHFKYHEGMATFKSNDGDVTPLSIHERWHWVDVPAKFQFVDSMCTYYEIRKMKPNQPSYSLDYTLEYNLGIRKLKFEEASHIASNTPDWHKFMQTKYMLEYVIYNVFDCISVEELDERTMDLCLTLPNSIHCSDLKNFTSTPRRFVDKLHWFLLEMGKVSGCSGSLYNELDKILVPVDGLIVALPAYLNKENDNDLFLFTKMLNHTIHLHVGDLDIAAAYPNGISVFNISRSTTVKELSSIEDIDYRTVGKYEGINLSGGVNNAAHFAMKMFKAPSFFDLDTAFKAHLAKKQTQ